MRPDVDDCRRWLALYVLCLGVLMIGLDTTIVNVALPSIRSELGFTETGLVWVVNAYMLTYGGFLLLGGRLGDLFGHRRLFLFGIGGFTIASSACGLARSQELLVVARALQGLSGAIVTAIALSLILQLFTVPTERVKAMGIYGFVSGAGGSIGVLLSGVLTSALSWHWIFFINVPVGVTVYLLSVALLSGEPPAARGTKLDVVGALTITISLILAVYAVVNGNDAGWVSTRTLGVFAVAAALLVLFVAVESQARTPLVPLGLFRVRNVATANVAGVLCAAGMFGWFFISALYLQLVRGYSALEVGIGFLPANLIMAVFSLGLSAKLVIRFGVKTTLVTGLLLAAAGLAILSRAPVDGAFTIDVLPGMILEGLGVGIAFNPMLLAATSGVNPGEAGLAAGIVNTSFTLGGALGLAVLASLAAARTARFPSTADPATALAAGYDSALSCGAAFLSVGAVLCAVLLHADRPAAAPDKCDSKHA